MYFSLRMQMIAVVQVMLTAIFTYVLVTNQYQDLSAQNLQALESFLIEQKQQELQNYTAIAAASVDHIYAASAADDEIAQKKVADILSTLIYNGDDGYFFVYHEDGTNIVLPTEPYRVGQNFWDLQNQRGEYTIQILIENAKNGGGFHRYEWNQPSKEVVSDKLSYSEFLPKWGWMMGTGVYLDTVKEQLSSIQQAIDKQVNNTRSIILLVALSSIFVIFAFGFLSNYKQKRVSEKKINQLGQKIVTLQEEEQRHISRELHDGIVQILVSIKYSIEATGLQLLKNKVEKPEPLKKAETNLSNAINEIRRISHHLHPRILDELGLSEAMESLGNEFSERTGIKVNIHKPAMSKLLPDSINTTLYRVVQESLRNVEKHANAKEVNISLVIANNWLSLSIQDDGDGLNAKNDSFSSGIGIRNLAERVEYHSGRFDIKSNSKGTKVTAKIPRSVFANHYIERRQQMLQESHV